MWLEVYLSKAGKNRHRIESLLKFWSSSDFFGHSIINNESGCHFYVEDYDIWLDYPSVAKKVPAKYIERVYVRTGNDLDLKLDSLYKSKDTTARATVKTHVGSYASYESLEMVADNFEDLKCLYTDIREEAIKPYVKTGSSLVCEVLDDEKGTLFLSGEVIPFLPAKEF